jgi:hypothetical protein
VICIFITHLVDSLNWNDNLRSRKDIVNSLTDVMSCEEGGAALGKFPTTLDIPEGIVEADFGEQILGAEQHFPVGFPAHLDQILRAKGFSLDDRYGS